jgi:hypothetical protein
VSALLQPHRFIAMGGRGPTANSNNKQNTSEVLSLASEEELSRKEEPNEHTEA